MVQEESIVQFCPICNKTLFRIRLDRIEFLACEHYRWWTDLGTIANDEIVLNGGMKMRLLKR